MAKTTNRNRRATASSGAAIAAVMLSAPTLAAPVASPPVDQAAAQQPAAASRSVGYEKQMSVARSVGHIKWRSEFKYKDNYSVAGIGDGHVVFEDERGQLFYVDSATGDQKFVSRHYTVKLTNVPGRDRMGTHKMMTMVHIVGVDADGRTIMTNPAGENFYLDPATGDMIFPK